MSTEITAPSTGTGLNPVMPAVAPTVGPSEIPSTSGPDLRLQMRQLNALDPSLYLQFRRLYTFRWDSTMRSGTVIYVQEVDPTKLGPIMRHLMQCYMSWSGGIQIAYNITATAFNSGSLIFVRVPPYIKDPHTLTLDELTNFPYSILDCKSTDINAIILGDTNRMRFHLSYPPNSSYNPGDDRGAYLVIAVYNPLVGSSPENSQCFVNLWYKLAQDFQVAQLIPPQITFADDSEWDQFFDSTPIDPMVFQPIEELLVTPTGALNNYQSLCYDINTGHPSTSSQYQVPLDQRLTVANSADQIRLFSDNHTPHYAKVTSSAYRISATVQVDEGDSLAVLTNDIDWNQTRVEAVNKINHSITGNTLFSTTQFIVEPRPIWGARDGYTTDVFTTLFGESLVTFTNDNSIIPGIPLLHNQIRLLKNHTLSAPTNLTPVFIVRDKSTSNPLFLIRLNLKGFFSAASINVPSIYNFADITIKYFTTIPSTDRLPPI